MKRWRPAVVIVIVLLVLVGAGAAWSTLIGLGNETRHRAAGVRFSTASSCQVPSFQQGDDKMARRSAGRRSRERHARRRRLRRGSGGDGVQVLWDRCRSAAVELVFNMRRTDYTEQGWLYWDRAAWFAPDRVRHVYEDLPSYQLIDSNHRATEIP